MGTTRGAAKRAGPYARARHTTAQVPLSSRSRRRGPNWPAIGLLALVSLLFVVGARAIFAGVDSHGAVVDDFAPIAKRSEELGEQFHQFLAEPSGNAALAGRDGAKPADALREWVTKARADRDAAAKIDIPEELTAAYAGFFTAMEARSRGTERFVQSVSRAVQEGGDPAELTSELVDVLRDLLTGDRAYMYALEAVGKLLEAEGDASALPPSAWFSDAAEAERPSVALFVQKLLGAPDVSGAVDVAILTLTTKPKPSAVEDGVAKVITEGEFEVAVTLKNLGERSTAQLAVKASLRPKGAQETQKENVEVEGLAPGDSRTVTVNGLLPAPGRNRVTVSIGPLPGELNVQDNIQSMETDVSKRP